VRDFFLSAGDIILKALGAAMGLLAGWPEGIRALGVMIAADYLTGILTAAAGKSPKSKHGGLSARASFLGLLRKGLMLLVILVASLADRMTGTDFVLRNMSIGFYLLNESISVLENVALMGVPIPGKLRNALEVLKRGEDEPPEQTARK